MEKKVNGRGNFLCLLFTLEGHDAGLLLLRLLAGGMLLPHGIQKAQNYSVLSTTFADPIGLESGLSLLLITLTEILGSILVITGLLTRPAALALMFGMFVATFLGSPEGFSFGSSQLPLIFLGIFTVLMITGAGRYSVDEAIRRRVCRTK